MLHLDLDLKKNIINKLEEIISIEQNNWNNLDIKIKIKLIHHYCNFININNIKNDNNINYDVNKIPLKSLKPKKFIQFACFNKQYNKKLYNDYLNGIKEYTSNFRNLFVKNKVYHTFSSLPKELYNNILNSYNKYVCDFLKKNKSLILVDNFYNNLVGNNHDKIIKEINEEKSLEIIEKDNKIELIFYNNIIIILELLLTSNKITNNISVKFIVKLINKL
jgi:hypothetical protein